MRGNSNARRQRARELGFSLWRVVAGVLLLLAVAAHFVRWPGPEVPAAAVGGGPRRP